MTGSGCGRIALADLIDYAAGDLTDADAATLEAHLFACDQCSAAAAEFDALVGAIGPAVRSAEVGGIVTDAVLNRLAREGVRMRSFTLSPGAIVPCAVWDDDELMVLRLRGDFGSGDYTLARRVAGDEVSRTTFHLSDVAHGEILYAEPAAGLRQLPVVEVELLLTAHEGGPERPIGRYTLVHGGALHR